jgi:hypothetical protein
MRRVLALVLLLASPALGAQEVCPVRHPALTALDHASMVAAFTASFRGIYSRNPTFAVGAGADDGNYWISAADHYGEFGDGVCRAGWNAYWETKLATGQQSVDPKLGDQPARFQPSAAPPVVPPPVVPPAPPPLDLSGVPAQLAALTATVEELARASAEAHAAIHQNVTDGRAENRNFFQSVAAHWKQITAVLGPAAAAFVAGKKL